MIRKPNKLRARIKQGKLLVGSAIHSWSPNVMEVGGYAGLDFMRIEGEHSWRRDFTAESLMRAAVIADIVPIFRVDKGDPFLVRKALEIGAGSVLVPFINTPEEARAVVRAAKFPPRGDRGYCGDCFSAYWGTRASEEWVRWSDSEPLIGVMIESVRAMDSIDEIMAVEGVDYGFFGAADYSMSIGLGRPDRRDTQVLAALERTIAAAEKADKFIGLPTEEEDIQMYVGMGIKMFEISSDLLLLDRMWRRFAGYFAGLR